LFFQRTSVFLLVVVVPFILGWFLIGADKWDLSVPFVYGMHDDVWQLLLTKGLQDNGWVLNNSYLGAPDVANWHYHAAAQTSSIHSVIMKVMLLFIENPIKVQQYYYFLNFSLITISAYLASKLLKIPTVFSIAIGIVFAFISFRFNTMFFAYLSNYFMIPLSVVVVVWCSRGAFTKISNGELLPPKQFFRNVIATKKFIFGSLIIFLMAISDGYYAFFTILLLGFSSIIVCFLKPNYKIVDSVIPFIFVTLIIIINYLVMLPVNQYKAEHFNEFNPNGILDSNLIKKPMEAEVYSSSLKLLVAPITNHRNANLADAGRYIVDTSDVARKFPTIVPIVSLGTLGSLCFLFTLLSLAFLKINVAKTSRFSDFDALIQLKALSLLSLIVFLCSISGGIGTLIALIYPTIRAYDRFPLFLLFLVFVNVATWLTCKMSSTKSQSKFLILPVSIVVIFAVWDQTPNTTYKPLDMKHVKRFLAERDFVRKIEDQLPLDSMIYQYPFSQYLSDNKYYGWGAFSHMRAYLHSKNLRWSNGASKNSVVDLWHSELSKFAIEDLAEHINLFGFAGLLIDRWVIGDKEYQEIKRILESKYGLELVTNETAAMAFFKLPKLGFKLLNNTGFSSLIGIEIDDGISLVEESLPSYINARELKVILLNESRTGKIIYDFLEYPNLFDANKYQKAVQKLDENLENELLLGDVVCNEGYEINLLKDKEINLRISNTSDAGWRINSGIKPITIGYHLYDMNDNLTLWDNGYRYEKVALIDSGRHKDIIIDLAELNVKEYVNFPQILVFGLLQEGNAWFDINPSNNVCKIKIYNN
jgi:hypothetical protein